MTEPFGALPRKCSHPRIGADGVNVLLLEDEGTGVVRYREVAPRL
jgi:hypothetical protein